MTPVARCLACLALALLLLAPAAAEVRYVSVPGFYATVRAVSPARQRLEVEAAGKRIPVAVTAATVLYRKQAGRSTCVASLRDFRPGDFVYVTSDRPAARPVVARGVYESNTLTALALRLHAVQEVYGKIVQLWPAQGWMACREPGGTVRQIRLPASVEVRVNEQAAGRQRLRVGDEVAVLAGSEDAGGTLLALVVMDPRSFVLGKMREVVAPQMVQGTVRDVDMRNHVLRLHDGAQLRRIYFDRESAWALGDGVDSPTALAGRRLACFCTQTSRPGLLYLCEAMDDRAVLETYRMIVKNGGRVPLRKPPGRT